MKTFLIRAGAFLALCLAFVGSFNLVSMGLDRESPIFYEGAKAVTSDAQRGGSIDVEFKVFRKRICDQTVRRYLTDSQGIRHAIPSYTVGLQMLAGRETYQRSITIPTAASVGPATYEVVIDYSCNVLQSVFGNIRVTSPPIAFNILPESGLLVAPRNDSDG